jgi:RND family efflux transporter MFP subunit
MPSLRSRPVLLVIAGLIILSPLAWYLAPSEGAEAAGVVAKVKEGEFNVLVTTTGELSARKFVQIQGPPNAQQAGAFQMKISSLVPEGTVVKEGDVVAELDRSAVAARAQDVSLALQKAEAQYTQAQLDSTLNLSKAREELRTLEFALEEKKLAKEQATYEAPTIRRQAEIDYEKAERALAQAKKDLVTKRQQAIARMSEVGAEVQRQRSLLTTVQGVLAAFTIRAPSPGMVIYVKEWNGKKKTAGAQISPWDPTVATLPDLGEMESVTYVNEIDVRKVAVGQAVRISLDSDPDKQLTGKVVSVANVGEQRPNADAKVFEVKITVEEADTTLRPGMTTANAIMTSTVADALYVPLEAVTNDSSLAFVYKRAGGRTIRQQIETGEMNDNEVVVRRGLAKGDEVLLAPPADAAALETRRLPDAPTAPASAALTAAPKR